MVKPVAFEVVPVRDNLIATTGSDQLVSEGSNWGVRHFKNTTVAPATTIITLRFGATPAVAYYGKVLYPGDSCTDSLSEGYVPYRGEIRMIASDNAGQLSVSEW